MHFTKMHGLGNDYVYVDCFRQPPPRDPAGLSRRISDRHFGVGSDGLILICPSERADARMRMFNADGSEGEMCGNGIRCVAKYVYDHGIAAKPRVAIETGRGILTLDLTIKVGKVELVRVDMGEPLLRPADIPTTLPGERVVNVPLPE
ncbi:MAG TPA: diaminopimelate epimerase, partial [Gemmataceae bacterium]|nr:diaminopimelate epimerase [Gemmataceae bacterium]